MNTPPKEPFRVPVRLFELGQVVATPGALEATTDAQRLDCLGRHLRGDWGVVCDEDRNANFKAMFSGNRILSAYQVGDSCITIWIITEGDRSVTTFLLPSEY